MEFYTEEFQSNKNRYLHVNKIMRAITSASINKSANLIITFQRRQKKIKHWHLIDIMCILRKNVIKKKNSCSMLFWKYYLSD